MKWIVRDNSWPDSIYCPEVPDDASITAKILVKFDCGTIEEWDIWSSSNSWESGGCIVAYALIEE